jgi:hypothetical protein
VATTASYDLGCYGTDSSVWYKFRSRKNQSVRITTDGSDFYASLLVATGSPTNLLQIACGLGSVGFQAVAGKTYYLMAASSYYGNGNLLQFAVRSFPALTATATVSPTVTVDPTTGNTRLHGGVLVSRPSTVYITGSVWAKLVPFGQIMIGTFSTAVQTDRKSTWEATLSPTFPVIGSNAKVYYSYYAEDDFGNTPSRNQSQSVRLIRKP